MIIINGIGMLIKHRELENVNFQLYEIYVLWKKSLGLALAHCYAGITTLNFKHVENLFSVVAKATAISFLLNLPARSVAWPEVLNEELINIIAPMVLEHIIR